jgi:hypothetical protein
MSNSIIQCEYCSLQNIFQKSSSHLKIQGVRQVAERKFCPEGPQKVDFCHPVALTHGICVPCVCCTLDIKIRGKIYVIGAGLQ